MTVHTPPRTSFSAMVTDPTVSKILLMDTGNYPSFSNFLNQTWTFSISDWTNTSATLIDNNSPLPGRTDMVMSFDGANVILYGGRGASSTAGVFQDLWSWNGSAWSKLSPATVPFGRYKAQACFLAGTGAVMFGGENLNSLLEETWIWSGSAWSQFTGATTPPARTGHVMAASTTQVIMFGGRGTNSQFGDTWKFDGSFWTQLTPTNPPSIRSEACMAYDSTNNLFVMFGGQNEFNYLDETWTYNPVTTTWTKISVPNGTGPVGKIGVQMAFDAGSGHVLMFGGINGNTNYPSNESWLFNSSTSTWQQI